MMQSQTHEIPRMAAAAERQMTTWSRLQDFQNAVAGHAQSVIPAVRYVTISREAGVDGTAIARLVADRLGWELYDKNLLDQVAQRFGESRVMLDLIDETPSNWVYDILGTWMDHHLVTHDRYVVQVARVIRMLARKGKAVFVGRGAQFLLPREHMLAVRLVASEAYRMTQIILTRKIEAAQAKQFVREADRSRRQFIERYFHHDINDPSLYDLVINVERLGPVGAVEQIISALALSTGNSKRVART